MPAPGGEGKMSPFNLTRTLHTTDEATKTGASGLGLGGSGRRSSGQQNQNEQASRFAGRLRVVRRRCRGILGSLPHSLPQRRRVELARLQYTYIHTQLNFTIIRFEIPVSDCKYDQIYYVQYSTTQSD